MDLLTLGLSLAAITVAEAQQPCDLPETVGTAGLALEAYAALNIPSFSANMATLSEALTCLAEPAPPSLVSQLHLLFALQAWVDQAPEETLVALRSLSATTSTYELSADLAPDGSRVRTLWDSARTLGPGETRALPDGSWVIDGELDAVVLPIERPALVQRRQDDGTWQTDYLLDTDQLEARFLPPEPAEPAPIDTPVTVENTEATRPATSRRSWVFLASGGVAGLAAGASAFAASSLKEGYYLNEQNISDAEKQRVERLNLVSGLGGYALSATATGLIATAVIAGEW